SYCRRSNSVGQYLLEAPVCQLSKGRDASRMAQKVFGGEDDQRFAERLFHLPAQEMKQLARGGRVSDLEIVLRTEREKPLYPGAGVLGPVPVIAVRKKQYHSAGPVPFAFTGGNELVDNHLSAVGKIAELGLPDGKPLRSGHAVAVFEAEDGTLGEHAVVYPESRPALQCGQRGVTRIVMDVMQHRVPVVEGAAAGVLAGEAHRHPFPEQGGKGKRLGVPPV